MKTGGRAGLTNKTKSSQNCSPGAWLSAISLLGLRPCAPEFQSWHAGDLDGPLKRMETPSSFLTWRAEEGVNVFIYVGWRSHAAGYLGAPFEFKEKCQVGRHKISHPKTVFENLLFLILSILVARVMGQCGSHGKDKKMVVGQAANCLGLFCLLWQRGKSQLIKTSAQPLLATGFTPFVKQMAKGIQAGSRMRGFSQESPAVSCLSWMMYRMR